MSRLTIPRWVLAGVALAVVWLFVSGTPGTSSGLAGGFLLGLVLSLPVAYLFRALFRGRSDLGRAPAVVPAAARYLALFVYELVTANLGVARRVLSPSLPLDPGVVVVPLRVESDGAVTTVANSITLTPGTLTMDHDAEANALVVHAVDVSDLDAVLAPIRRWERYAIVIFDEDVDPAAPAPPARLEPPEGDDRD